MNTNYSPLSRKRDPRTIFDPLPTCCSVTAMAVLSLPFLQAVNLTAFISLAICEATLRMSTFLLRPDDTLRRSSCSICDKDKDNELLQHG